MTKKSIHLLPDTHEALMAYILTHPDAKAKRIVDAALRTYLRDVLFVKIGDAPPPPKNGRPPVERKAPDGFLGIPERRQYAGPEETPLPVRNVLEWIIMGVTDPQGYRLPIFKRNIGDGEWVDKDGVLLRGSFVDDLERGIKLGGYKLVEYKVEEEVDVRTGKSAG